MAAPEVRTFLFCSQEQRRYYSNFTLHPFYCFTFWHAFLSSHPFPLTIGVTDWMNINDIILCIYTKYIIGNLNTTSAVIHTRDVSWTSAIKYILHLIFLYQVLNDYETIVLELPGKLIIMIGRRLPKERRKVDYLL